MGSESIAIDSIAIGFICMCQYARYFSPFSGIFLPQKLHISFSKLLLFVVLQHQKFSSDSLWSENKTSQML